MKNLIKFSVLFIIICTFSFTLQDKPDRIVKLEEFEKHIDTLDILFEMPENYKEAIVKSNRDLYYSFAIKNKREDFEVRYSIWSLKNALVEYERCKADPNCMSIHPNSVYKGRAQANVLNMTAGESMNYGNFPPLAVKKEFNADAGGSSFFEFNCKFGEGYKYGQMVVLHKDDVADVIITYLSNDKEKHPDLMNVPFHSLTFK